MTETPRNSAKQWESTFSSSTPFTERPFVKTRQKIGAIGDALDIFIRGTGSPKHTWISDVVKSFCIINRPTEATAQVDSARAWLDDRDVRVGRNRVHPKWQTAQELRSELEKLRFNLCGEPDVHRRLLYISQLTPAYITALAETVSDLQVDALRDAVANHISCSTSIRVHMPIGYPTFRLEFHLPCLELRHVDDRTIDPSSPIHHRPATVLSDLSFLNLESTGEGRSHYCVQKSHVSVVICGQDNLQWVGYAFKNGADDEEDQSDASETDRDEYRDQESDEDGNEDGGGREDEDGDEEGEEDEDGGGFQADLFASEDSYRVLDANIPIYDAREYWLCVVDLRLSSIVAKWEYVVYKVEQGVKNHKQGHSLMLSHGLQDRDGMRIEQHLHWNVQTTQLLNELRSHLCPTLKAWDRFNEPSGDKCYFSDITEQKPRRRLNSIKASFERLNDLDDKLVSLDRATELSAKNLERYMSFRNHRLVLEGNRLNFESNKLRFENNRVNMEICALNRQTHSVSLQTSTLSREIAHLTRKSTEAGQSMGRISWISIELFLFTTTIIIVLQYFSVTGDIFSFRRNTQTFIICNVVLFVVLRLFVAVVTHPEYIFKLLPRRNGRHGQGEVGGGHSEDGIELP